MSDTIYIKSKSEIELMRQAGKITAGARSIARQAIKPGPRFWATADSLPAPASR